MTEEEKIKETQGEALKSIEEVCSDTWEAIYRFIYSKVQNRQEAEEITQETYVKALAYLQKNNIKIDKYTAYLKTISLNILRDKWRKNKRQGKVINIEAINPMEAAIDDVSEASAQRELVQNALDCLNEEQRLIVELRIIKGYSSIETARIMNKKEGTIRVIQYRALQRLSEILKNNELP